MESQNHKGETMSNPTKLIINCETKEQIEVELTDAEVKQLEADRVKAEADKAKADADLKAKADTKAAVIKRLGLSEDEVAALLS
jgi:hypothetical protein